MSSVRSPSSRRSQYAWWWTSPMHPNAELKARSDQMASTDTIPHPSNAVSIVNLLLPRAD
jgi:hypothetical protein